LTYLETLKLEGNPIRFSDTLPLRDLLDENPKLDIDIGVAVREAGGPNVEFSDVNLARTVRGRLGIATIDGVDVLKIPKAQLVKLRTLDVESYGIKDLTGLEHATQLRELRLERNEIRDITPLAELTNLTTLYLSYNNIVNITALAELTNLTNLRLWSNPIRDVSPLAELAGSLESLTLGSNNIHDVSLLAELAGSLESLTLGSNNIHDVSLLAELAGSLESLSLGSDNIHDISPLAELAESLESLTLTGNNIRDITPLAELAESLESLTLTGNNIRDITPLAELTNLTYLNLGNEIRDITPLAELTNLRRLLLDDNQIRDVTPLAQLTNLTYLNLEDNQIRDVSPLANLKYLEELELSGNPITDTSPLSRLLDENPVLDIDIEVVREAKLPTVTETSTNATVSILPSPVASPTIGQQLEFSLNIAGGKAVAGYQAVVRFDTTALRYVSSANGDFLPAGAFFVQPKVAGNLVKLNAASLASESDGDGTLATLTFEVLAVKASTLVLSDVLLSNKAGASAIPKVENAQITESTGLQGDVNSDGIVNIQDLVLVASSLGTAGQNTADVNGDGLVNIQDLVLVAGALGTSAAAPSLNAHVLSTLPAADVQQWLSQAQQRRLTDVTSLRGIQFLEQLLVALTPKKTSLLANYPNPFNPETWIPYQLSKDAEVTLTIYAIDGRVVRRLSLGHQPAGLYKNRSHAAYWDGRNALGEPVASGVYFYTFTAGDFSATRKMLIRK
jgi:Leucine-rich repeat (LRR) protein